MSRGPGKIERVIEAAFASTPDDILTVEDLATLAYPGINRVEKKHRVAVIRAASNVCRRTDWSLMYPRRPGGAGAYVNLRSVRSHVLGKIRVSTDTSGPQGHTTDELRLMVDGHLEPQWNHIAERVRGMKPGQQEWASVQINCARLDGRQEDVENLLRQFKLLVYGRISEIKLPERPGA